MRLAVAAAPKWPGLPRHVSGPLVTLVGPLGLLLVWSICARNGWLPPQILPSPSEVGLALLDMARSGDLAKDTAISLLRVVEGFGAGASIGLLLGVAMGFPPRSRTMSSRCSPHLRRCLRSAGSRS
jgi:sulfonate transport system permease protein